MTQEEKLTLQWQVQEGRYSETFLAGYYDAWLKREELRVLSDLLKATPSELLELQSRYRATKSLYNSFVSVITQGKKAAKKIHDDK